jgi:hypothetical protein
VDDEILFSEDLDIESPVSVSNRILRLGDLHIDLANATLWNPHPAWESLHARKNDIHQQLAQSEITDYLQTPGFYPPPGRPSELYRLRLQGQSPLSHLTSALAAGNRVGAQEYASRLAGAGIGLTPAGDDVLMGGIYASWIIHPFEVASVLARDIASTAASLTTSLSAEWLRAAGRGEAGIRWHEFFDALLAGENRQISRALAAIVQVGETSGADALAGFYGTLMDSGIP